MQRLASHLANCRWTAVLICALFFDFAPAQSTLAEDFSAAVVPMRDVFRVELGTIGLVPENLDEQLLAVDENLVPILDGSDLQRELQFGFYCNLDLLNLSDSLGGVDMRFGYWGINSIDAEAALEANQVISIFFNGIPATPPTSTNYHYTSNLYSSEWNLRCNSRSNFRPFAGFRFFKVEEVYDAFQFTGNGGKTGFFSLTNNLMLGGHAGLEVDIPLGKYIEVYSHAKYGFLNNRVEVSARVADPVTGGEVNRFIDTDTFASLAEGGLGLNWDFAGPLSLRAGYHVVFLNQVALGLDQSESISVFPRATDQITFVSQIWHGLELSTVFQF